MTVVILFALLALVFVVLHFRSPEQPKKADPKPRLIVVDGADPDWRSQFHANCESPAEIAFIDAMIDSFGLKPKHGALFSGAIRIDLQVKQDHYRADFMANRWLVIEVDGAAWHGSEKAKARDAERDLYFENLGYTVLRIPAKTVFNDPSTAVRSVKAALAIGKRIVAEAPPKSGFERLAETGSTVSSIFRESFENQRLLLDVRRALEPARIAFEFEKDMIQQAFEMVERERSIKAYLDTEEKRRSFDSSSSRIRQSLAELEASGDQKREKIVVPVFPLSISSSGMHAEEIDRKFAQIQGDRTSFLRSVERRLSGDLSLKNGVVNALHRYECSSLVPLIASE